MRLPKVHSELSCGQVLTMSRVRGLRLQEFLKTNPAQAVRDQIGVGLTRLFFFQLFRVQALHADPHPGNYLFDHDGGIGLVDFGCVKYLKPEAVRCYARFWSREWVHDAALFAGIIRVVFGPGVSPDEPRIRRCMNGIRRFYDEFHPLTKGAAPLELGDPKVHGGVEPARQDVVEEQISLAGVSVLVARRIGHVQPSPHAEVPRAHHSKSARSGRAANLPVLVWRSLR